MKLIYTLGNQYIVKMSQNIHAQTKQIIPSTGIFTGDNETFEMLPDNTLIKCQFVSHKDKPIKADGSPGLQWVSNVRVIEHQKIYWSDIVYTCEYPIGSEKIRYTRASLLEKMTLNEI